jgi:hypothetical protein
MEVLAGALALRLPALLWILPWRMALARAARVRLRLPRLLMIGNRQAAALLNLPWRRMNRLMAALLNLLW